MEKINQMIVMEKQAAEFYKAYINSFKDKGVKKIFSTLMNISHANETLINDSILQGIQFNTGEEEAGNNLFTCLSECGCAYVYTDEIGIYSAGSDMERKIIGYYEETGKKVNEKRMLDVIKYLIDKHKSALYVLDDMIRMLNRNKDWVESAEFTIREPY